MLPAESWRFQGGVQVKIGFSLFGIGPRSHAAVVQQAERSGFDSIWIPEHLVFPAEIPPTYPYTEDGRPPIDPSTPLFDPWVSLAFLAASSERILLGTSVYILPLRDPFVTARAVTTLDRVSQGRAILGIGVGWLKEEFDAVGQDFHTRGKRTDEIIHILKRLWTEETIEHHGEFYDFGAVKFQPKPSQKPHPPIIVGGTSQAALRRAARLGDGWLGVGNISPEQARGIAQTLQRFREEAGRADQPFEVGTSNALEFTLDNVRRYEEAGVDRLTVGPPMPADGRLNLQNVVEFMERTAEEIIGKL